MMHAFSRYQLKARMFFQLLMKVILGITIFCLFNPLIPALPSNIPLDPSWVIGLNQAVAQKIAFGQDLIFTFGPYAAVYTKAFHPATNHLEMIGSAYLAILYIMALLTVLEKSNSFILICLWIVLAGFTTHLDALFLSYALLVGIYCWQIFYTPPSNTSQHNHQAITMGLLFSGFGLYPLIKGPHFVVFLPIALIAMIAFVRKRAWLEACLIPISIATSMIGFWLYSGQPLVNLPDYFFGLMQLINGFAQAMSMYGDSVEPTLYLISAGSILIFLLLQKGLRFRALWLSLIFFFFLMAAFKAGFVRHDGHALMGSNSLIIAAIFVAAIYQRRVSYALLLLSCAIFLKIESHYKPDLLQHLLTSATQTYSSTWQGLQLRIFHPQAISQQFHQALNSLANEKVLPKLDGSVDIFPFDQAYLIASGNVWSPRPVFQSYHAYTKSLADKNQQFFASKRSPDYLFFRIESIDDRLPTGDDGSSWSSLLTYYQPNGFAGQYLILKKVSRPTNPKMFPVLQGTYEIGKWIEAPKESGRLFATINLQPSWRGKLKNMLYKSSPLEIHVRLQDQSIKHFRLVPGIAQSTFLLSPLIESAREFQLLYQSTEALNQNHVEAFSITTQGNPKDWEQTYQISLENLQ
jgi:hypothetical protein